MTKGRFKVVAVRRGSRCHRPAVHCASANHSLSFGGEVEVAAMTATTMSSRWLQQKRAVDSAMRVGGGRSRRQ